MQPRTKFYTIHCNSWFFGVEIADNLLKIRYSIFQRCKIVLRIDIRLLDLIWVKKFTRIFRIQIMLISWRRIVRIEVHLFKIIEIQCLCFSCYAFF